MSFIDDPGGLSVDFIAVESPDDTGHKQALWVAVRHVYYGNEQSEDPMVQIAYQEEHMASQLAGPVFLSVSTWRTLNRAVEHRIKAHDKRKRWFRRFGPLQRGHLRSATTCPHTNRQASANRETRHGNPSSRFPRKMVR